MKQLVAMTNNATIIDKKVDALASEVKEKAQSSLFIQLDDMVKELRSISKLHTSQIEVLDTSLKDLKGGSTTILNVDIMKDIKHSLYDHIN